MRESSLHPEPAMFFSTFLAGRFIFTRWKILTTRKDTPHSERRIKALKKVQFSLKKVFELAEKNGLKLSIDGSVEITIIE